MKREDDVEEGTLALQAVSGLLVADGDLASVKSDQLYALLTLILRQFETE